MRFFQIDVFTDAAYGGNQLAVFLDAGHLTRDQMQRIASEMNLSETTFVTEVEEDSYAMRIFTPRTEFPFAGHPTIGTAWLLRTQGRLRSDAVVQITSAGETAVAVKGSTAWFERSGTSDADLIRTKPDINLAIARAIGVPAERIGCEAYEIGRDGRFEAAVAEAGKDFLIVPLSTRAALDEAVPDPQAIADLTGSPLYCFWPEAAGRVHARAFFPPEDGVIEDAATGSAAAALGGYLKARTGPIELRIHQGLHVGRPSRIELRVTNDRIRVGGGCALVFEGELASLP